MLLERNKGINLIFDGQYLLVQLRNKSPFMIARVKYKETEIEALERYIQSKAYKELSKKYKPQIESIIKAYFLTKYLELLK